MVDTKRIDYVMVVYKNYRLLDIQREIFSQFDKKDYRIILVDNTPDNEKQEIKLLDNEVIYFRNSVNEFDGVSHGNAIDLGLKYVETDVACIIDTDFFLLDKDIHSYVRDKFNKGYESIGTEFGSYLFKNKYPSYLFNNMPVIYCNYIKTSLATSMTTVVTREEVNLSTSFVEVGWRYRDYYLKNNTKTHGWKVKNYLAEGQQIYINENDKVVGLHYLAGSSVRINEDFYAEYNRVKNEYC